MYYSTHMDYIKYSKAQKQKEEKWLLRTGGRGQGKLVLMSTVPVLQDKSSRALQYNNIIYLTLHLKINVSKFNVTCFSNYNKKIKFKPKKKKVKVKQSFSDQQKQGKFVASTPALQALLKNVKIPQKK